MLTRRRSIIKTGALREDQSNGHLHEHLYPLCHHEYLRLRLLHNHPLPMPKKSYYRSRRTTTTGKR
jgi:hypothetical protein